MVIFEAFNRYAGVAVGENLGYLFTAFWTVLVATAMFGSALPLGKWLGLLGMVSAAAILVGTLEPAGFEPVADIVVIGYILWSVWLALFGAVVLRTKPLATRVSSVDLVGSPTAPVELVGGTLS